MKPHPRGAEWEQRAEQYLRDRGLQTLERNFHCRLGELDLVMRDGEATVFVEVRYRHGDGHGGGLGSVTRAKRLKIVRAAGIFLSRRPRLATGPCRFDVVAITGEPRAPRFDWVRAAFDAY
ncbi:YraN family protein [Marinihelvus fidelis]|uniref:UPF0102 protein F3N42_14335 n=1 Tax=Marinihelvus fidelis TaxID=2613842 RepID=A0A5N0T3S6_9GAMM|nr:YraN family protein [Marinihelvus fidelis]KAA9129715.1 YraN family protein [Marinihelvus fidelis]